MPWRAETENTPSPYYRGQSVNVIQESNWFILRIKWNPYIGYVDKMQHNTFIKTVSNFCQLVSILVFVNLLQTAILCALVQPVYKYTKNVDT
jgi:hypothetical protein